MTKAWKHGVGTTAECGFRQAAATSELLDSEFAVPGPGTIYELSSPQSVLSPRAVLVITLEALNLNFWSSKYRLQDISKNMWTSRGQCRCEGQHKVRRPGGNGDVGR